MKLTAKISYPTSLVLNLEGFAKGGSATKAVLLTTLESLAIRLQSKVKDNLSGKVLNVRSGALRRSIGHSVVDAGNGPVATVYSRGVPYAAIHEFGGTTRPHLIAAKNAKALHFKIGGRDVFAKLVNHPGSVIPERSYLRSALKDMEPEIKRELIKALLMNIGTKDGYYRV